MYVVDASVWVSRLVPEDVHYGTSHRWLGRLVEQGEFIVAPALVLAEVAGAVSRRTGLSETGTQAVSLIQRLPHSRLVPVDAELIRLGTTLAADLCLRGVDALYVALARRLGVPLVTWDREQHERGRDAAVTLTPLEALNESS